MGARFKQGLNNSGAVGLDQYLPGGGRDQQSDSGIDLSALQDPCCHLQILQAAVGAGTKKSLIYRDIPDLRDRFGIIFHLDFYSEEELKQIVVRSTSMLNVEIDDQGAREIAGRSRATPRVANRLTRRVRDYAQVRGNGRIDKAIAEKAEATAAKRKSKSAKENVYNAAIRKIEDGGRELDHYAVLRADASLWRQEARRWTDYLEQRVSAIDGGLK